MSSGWRFVGERLGVEHWWFVWAYFSSEQSLPVEPKYIICLLSLLANLNATSLCYNKSKDFGMFFLTLVCVLFC